MAVRIAQDLGRVALGDGIARLEVAERDRQAVGGDVGHVLGLDHRIAEQGRRAPRDQPRLPDIRPVRSLELADRHRRGRIHHEHRALAIRLAQRLHQVHQLVLRIGRRERPRGARAEELQAAHRAHPVRGRGVRRRQETERLAHPRPLHERRPFGARKFDRDLVGEIFLDIEHRIVEHLLRHRRIGIKVARRRHDFGERRGRAFDPRAFEPDPARWRPAGRHQLAVIGAADLDHVGDGADRRDRGQRMVDRLVDLARHGKAARRIGRAADRLLLQSALRPAAQILLDERGRRCTGLDPVERRPLARDHALVDAPLEQRQLILERRHLAVIALLQRLERGLELVRLHFDHVLLPLKKGKKKGRENRDPPNRPPPKRF